MAFETELMSLHLSLVRDLTQATTLTSDVLSSELASLATHHWPSVSTGRMSSTQPWSGTKEHAHFQDMLRHAREVP